MSKLLQQFARDEMCRKSEFAPKVRDSRCDVAGPWRWYFRYMMVDCTIIGVVSKLMKSYIYSTGKYPFWHGKLGLSLEQNSGVVPKKPKPLYICLASAGLHREHRFFYLQQMFRGHFMPGFAACFLHSAVALHVERHLPPLGSGITRKLGCLYP